MQRALPPPQASMVSKLELRICACFSNLATWSAVRLWCAAALITNNFCWFAPTNSSMFPAKLFTWSSEIRITSLPDFFQLFQDEFTLLFVVNAIGTNYRKSATQTHHYIGVVNEFPFIIYGLISIKNDRSHVKIFAKFDKEFFVGSRRQGAIGNAIGAIQKQTTRSF